MSDVPPPGWNGPTPPPQPYGQQPHAPIWPAAPPPAAPPGVWPAGPPPAPSGYQPYNPYGANPYGGGRSHPRGTLILVFGILGLAGFMTCVTFPFGIAAWVMGQSAMNEIRADPTTTYTNAGQVNAGRICGIVATCLFAAMIAFFAIVIAFAPD